MLERERSALVECAQNIEDALIAIEKQEKDKNYYIIRELLRAVRLLIIDKLR